LKIKTAFNRIDRIIRIKPLPQSNLRFFILPILHIL